MTQAVRMTDVIFMNNCKDATVSHLCRSRRDFQTTREAAVYSIFGGVEGRRPTADSLEPHSASLIKHVVIRHASFT